MRSTDRNAQDRKWLRYYLDFCRKYGHGYLEEQSLALFAEKLLDKGQCPLLPLQFPPFIIDRYIK